MKRRSIDEASAVDVFAVIIVVLVIIVGIMSILLYTEMTAPSHGSAGFITVEENDQVHFIYTGYLENSLVFETLDENVAMDNESFPKSLLYEWPEDGVFDPVSFQVGNGIPHENFDGMVDSGRILEEAMIDLRVNETISVIVLPEYGFGDHDPSQVRTLSLTETKNQIEIISSLEFSNRYDAPVIVNTTFKDPTWGWDVRVSEVELGSDDPDVTIVNLPDEGVVYSPYVGFNSRVVRVESGIDGGLGEIELEHILIPSDSNNVMGISPHGDGKFIVVGVNEAAGTFEADFNSEKAGAILRYEITVVEIEKG